MTGRDEILLAHGCDVKGFYRGDAVRLDDGRTGLVLDSDPRWHTTVLLTPREQVTVLTATLAHADAYLAPRAPLLPAAPERPRPLPLWGHDLG